MKKKLVALACIGFITMNSISVSAGTISGSESGNLGGTSVTGVATADNVNNIVRATATASAACGMQVQAVIVYNNGKREESIPVSKYGTDCTASIQKSHVQMNGGVGVFLVEKAPYSWTRNVVLKF